MEFLRATETWQRAGAYYVRIQAMAKKHHIPLRQEFDEKDGPDTRYIVALEEGFPVATARFYPLDGRRMMIGRVVVLPEYRRRGVGARVVEACEAWIRELGYPEAVLDSRENKTAFYEKLGYAVVDGGVIEGDTFRCIRMTKELVCSEGKPKIAVVCDVLGEENNGTTIAAMNLIRHLRSREYDVRVVCPDTDREGQPGYYVVPQLNVGPLNEYVRKNGVSIAVSDDTVLSAALRDADVIHIMTPFFLGKAAVDFAREHGIPVTAGFHCQAENITNHLRLMNSRLVNDLTYKAMYRLVYQYVDAIHYPTQFIREIFEAEVGRTNGYVISNGVNSRFVRRAAERPAEWEDRFVILFTGRYGKEKSHKVLIDAAAASRHEEKLQLVFAGEGPLREELAEYAGKLTHPPLMKFFSRDELLNVINGADLYVHPAEIEIEAIACLEAISCGLVPVIADSPRSATRFFALEENNLFRYNDPADLTEKIDYWLEHPEEKARCSERYLGYTRRFEQRRCMEEMEKMLLTAAGRDRSDIF